MGIIRNKNIKIKSQIAQTSENNNKNNQNKRKKETEWVVIIKQSN